MYQYPRLESGKTLPKELKMAIKDISCNVYIYIFRYKHQPCFHLKIEKSHIPGTCFSEFLDLLQGSISTLH